VETYPESKEVIVLTLKLSELHYRRLFETTQDGILILDAETGAITDVNPFLINMLGYSREELVKKKLWEVGAFIDIGASQDAFEALQKNEYIRYENLPLKAKDGNLKQVEFVSNVYLMDEVKMIQCNIRDITDRKQAQGALIKSEGLLRELSVRDHLTGLYNRRYMEETLDRELLRAKRKHFSLGIIMLDIDNFKQFNDACGHAVGDEILHGFGNMILDHVRGDDVPSRHGGDEFVIIMPDSSLEVTLQRAKQLCENAGHFHFHCEGKILKGVTLSLGVAIFPQHGSTSTDILKAADVALYRAKFEGRNRIVVAKNGNSNPE
jgi:diguanylate cyclase (GGDEF)-like protein/PAS domain S-box-containing protein